MIVDRTSVRPHAARFVPFAPLLAGADPLSSKTREAGMGANPCQPQRDGSDGAVGSGPGGFTPPLEASKESRRRHVL